MTTNDEIRSLVDIIKYFKPGSPLKSYIAYAVFPRFKNIEPGTRVDFEFPLTALAGPNGIGKSSLLHALWGMPHGYSTSKFWFATDLDPIQNIQNDPQRYFYGHWNESYQNIVETRKARLGKKVDYWEPYRRSAPDGMLPLPIGTFEGKAKDRWNPVRREVIYINLKMEIGSFDRYFHLDDGKTASDKRAVLLLTARRLKSIKEKKTQSFTLGHFERVFENRDLTNDELKAVSQILGRSYESARLIRHSLYPGKNGKNLSVVFKRGAEYSEAFAGSGEIAAVSAVVQILAAEKYSLILLDEPETSLHPGAQRAFLKFLLEQIKIKQHQIVISTHSSEFLTDLPHEAIKVFEDNGKLQSRILPRSSASAALIRLGKLPENKRRVIVEDSLAELLLLHALKGLDPGDAEMLEVVIAPSGAESILKYIGPSSMASKDSVFIFLDGDKKKVSELTDPDNISIKDQENLDKIVMDEIGVNPMYHIPGGKDIPGKLAAKKKANIDYLKWLRKRLAFLPRSVPEHIILEALEPNKGHANKSSADAKLTLKQILAEGTDVSLTGTEIASHSKVKIAKFPQNNVDIVAIREQLKAWAHSK